MLIVTAKSIPSHRDSAQVSVPGVLPERVRIWPKGRAGRGPIPQTAVDLLVVLPIQG